jgi:ketosteroid isomerase-like protein
MDGLEERLRLLEAERAIVRLLHAYAHAIDYGDEEAWVDCFTEDGVFDVQTRIVGDRGYRTEGRDALRRFISAHSRAPELFHKHVLVEPLIDVGAGGDTATCSSYFAGLQDHDGRPEIRVFGRYRDRIVLGADGRWRFRERIAEVESRKLGLPPFAFARHAEG